MIMRKSIGGVALLLGLGLTTPLWAQQASLFGNSKPLVFVPIDTSQAIAPPPQFAAQRTSFVDLFRRIGLPSFPVLFGSSNLPSPGQFPTYPNYQAVPFVPANNLPRYIPPGFPKQ